MSQVTSQQNYLHLSDDETLYFAKNWGQLITHHYTELERALIAHLSANTKEIARKAAKIAKWDRFLGVLKDHNQVMIDGPESSVSFLMKMQDLAPEFENGKYIDENPHFYLNHRQSEEKFERLVKLGKLWEKATDANNSRKVNAINSEIKAEYQVVLDSLKRPEDKQLLETNSTAPRRSIDLMVPSDTLPDGAPNTETDPYDALDPSGY